MVKESGMKKALVVLIALLFLAGIAEAEKFKRADKNKDGIVDVKEKQAAKKHKKKAGQNKNEVINEDEIAAWKKLRMEKMDLNRDGKIDADEKRISWRHVKSRANTAIKKKYDLNGDGWLDQQEAKKLLKDKYEIIKTKGEAKVDTNIEEGYDTNEDGVIDSEEAEAIKEDANL